jgi:hypothetical protein
MHTLIALLQLAPTIWALVRSVEDLWPRAQSGQEKLDLVLQTVRAGYDATEPELKKIPWDKLVDGVTRMIGAAVSWFNRLGVFHQSEASQ